MTGEPGMPVGEDARALVHRVTGRPVTSVRRLPGSVANRDFMVGTTDGAFVVKIGPAPELEAESWACTLLAGSVPVPEVVHLERLPAGDAALVLVALASTPSPGPGAWREVGAAMRQLHEHRLTGWGPVTCDPDGSARGSEASPAGPVERSMADLPRLVAAGLVEADLAEAVRRTVQDLVLAPGGAGVLLHHDLKRAHVFTDAAGRLDAIIDWGDVRVGDPLAEVARVSMSGPAALQAFLAGYGLWATDGLRASLAAHRILWNLESLAYEHRAGGDWFDVYRTWIVADVLHLLRDA